MGALKQDLRFGLRLLARTPGALVTAVLALALGIGANSAVFSVVHTVLLEPLPCPEPDRVVAIYDTQPALKTAPASYPKYIDWRDQTRVFDAVGGSVPSTSVLTGAGDPERIRTSRTTASLCRVFAVQPQLGRCSMLFNVAPTDPLVFGAACAAMVLAASAACLVPARAAARVDPVVTLKA